MSDTPKTDELAKRDFIPDGVWIRHARELERENDALRADKARLDWMQEMNLTVLHHAGNVFGRGVKVPSTRQAIDAAMKEGK